LLQIIIKELIRQHDGARLFYFKSSCRRIVPLIFFGEFPESRKYFFSFREVFQNPESIFPVSGKLFRIPKVFFPSPGNFPESRKYFSRLRETFRNPENFPTSSGKNFRNPESIFPLSGKLSGFRKGFAKEIFEDAEMRRVKTERGGASVSPYRLSIPHLFF
jgi:hypothetical protein